MSERKWMPSRLHLVWAGLGAVIGGLVVRYWMSDISEGLAIVAAAGLTAIITAYQLHATAEDRRAERREQRSDEQRADAALVLGDIEAARARLLMELSMQEKRDPVYREQLTRQQENIRSWEKAGRPGPIPEFKVLSPFPSLKFRALEADPLAVKSLPPDIIRGILMLRNLAEEWDTEEVNVEVAVKTAEGNHRVIAGMAEALELLAAGLRPIAGVQPSTLADQLTKGT